MSYHIYADVGPAQTNNIETSSKGYVNYPVHVIQKHYQNIEKKTHEENGNLMYSSV